jgi:hypothetical protein
MTLVNARAAFEKAVTDAVVAADNTVSVINDNVPFTTPGKTKKYITMNLNFTQSTIQNQGASSDYYSGVIQCNIYVPKNKGTSVVSAISESVIDGLISVNASDYTDSFSCTPRVADVNGPNMLQIEDRSHFIGIVSCQFTANA